MCNTCRGMAVAKPPRKCIFPIRTERVCELQTTTTVRPAKSNITQSRREVYCGILCYLSRVVPQQRHTLPASSWRQIHIVCASSCSTVCRLWPANGTASIRSGCDKKEMCTIRHLTSKWDRSCPICGPIPQTASDASSCIGCLRKSPERFQCRAVRSAASSSVLSSAHRSLRWQECCLLSAKCERKY